MRLVHTGDWHVGYRQFDRTGPGGKINLREWDVARTLARTIDQIIALDPELVLLAGDLTHTRRPSNESVLELHGQITRLLTARPQLHVVAINGNHDKAEPNYDGGLVNAWSYLAHAFPTFHPVLDTPKVVKIAGQRIVCVPELTAHRTRLDGQSAGGILLLHGEVVGMAPGERKTAIASETLTASPWQYIALGHWHSRTDFWPNGGYAGSIDYTSSDIWSEARSGIAKGIIEFDTSTQVRTFHPIPLNRAVIDLPPIDGDGRSRAEMIALALAALEPVDPEAIVRQVVTGVLRGARFGVGDKPFTDARHRPGPYYLDVRGVGQEMGKLPLPESDLECSGDGAQPCPSCGMFHT